MKSVEFIIINPIDFICRQMRKIFLYIKFGKQWIECPKNYNFSIGEKVILNPFKRPEKFKKNIGHIKRSSFNFAYVIFDGREVYCTSSDLLIDKNFIKRRKKLKIKYKKIDPFEEEIWSE